jgi:hypothetical protein
MNHWAKLLVLLMVLSVMIWVGLDFLMPDDCESKYLRVKVGMTESEVGSVMARKNVLRRLVTKGQRLRRASGVTSLWTEEWYEGEEELIGLHFQWDGNGRLSTKAIWKNGKWIESSE